MTSFSCVFSLSFPHEEEIKELLSLIDIETEPHDDRLYLPREVKGQTVPSQAVLCKGDSVAQKSGDDSELDR